MIDTQESMTAKLCSFARAYHSNYGRQKIFDDYLAYDMMGKEEYEEIGRLIERGFNVHGDTPNTGFRGKTVYAEMDRYISPIPLSRIAFAERELNSFADQYGVCQYVICGAGMDTFAFRNENSNIRIFELDHPDTQKYKLEKICRLEWNIPQNVHFVAVDFAKDDMKTVLQEAGFDKTIPTFFAILGVTYYLTLPVFEQTLAHISELSAKDSKVVFDYPDETTFMESSTDRVKRLSQITEGLGEPMTQGYLLAELEKALKRHSFDIAIHLPPEKIQKEFFTDRTDRQTAFENIHFIAAVKKEETNMNTFIFTSESVTKGHPDKVSDIISDSILDAYLEKDPYARVAAETTVKNNTVVLLGEVSSTAEIDVESVVRDAIEKIGYNQEELGFNSNTAKIINLLDAQSPDIAQGVDRALEVRDNGAETELGAGDQGMVFGYATNETSEFMPLPIALAHKLAKQLTKVRENGTLPYLRPDGKTQISVVYDEDTPIAIDTVVISTQHNETVSQETIREDLINHVITPILPKELLNDQTRILINPTGRFVIGGPVGDSGLTGRKIIVDTYGGMARHGGGAFSGKDPTKVDRSAAYAARYLAKNIVAAGLAKKAEIQIAYAIGVAAPVSIEVNTFGTGIVLDRELEKRIAELVDLRPGAIIRRFDLRRPIYTDTAAYGHFGREELNLPWENTDIAEELKKCLHRR